MQGYFFVVRHVTISLVYYANYTVSFEIMHTMYIAFSFKLELKFLVADISTARRLKFAVSFKADLRVGVRSINVCKF